MIRCLLLVGVLLSTLFHTSAQNFKVNAPNSRLGIGEYFNEGLSRNVAMGGIGVSNPHQLFINVSNPALLSETKYTVFEGGLLRQFRSLKTNSATQGSADLIPAYIAISLPITKSWKSGFLLSPYTYSNYNSSYEREVIGSTSGETTTTTIEGFGGLNKFSFINGVKIGSNLSLGLTASYLFGKQEDNETSQLSTTSSYTTINEKSYYSGFQFKSGIAYRKELKKVEVPVRAKLVTSNDAYLSVKDQIKICMDSLSSLSDLTLKEKQSICNGQVEKMQKKLVFKDSLFKKDVFFGKNFVDSIAKTSLVGEYFMLIPNYSELVYHSSIKNKVLKLQIKKFIKGFKTQGYGVFVKKEAEKVGETEWTRDLSDLIIKKESIKNDDAVVLTNNYLKRKSGIYFNTGLTVLFGSSLNADREVFENTFNSGGFLTTSDTLNDDNKDKVKLPMEITFGISFDKPAASGDKANGFLSKSTWSFGTEAFFLRGEDYSNPFEENNLNNSYGLRVGGEIVPDINAKLRQDYFKRVFYRFGAVARTMPYEQNGKPVEDFGITFGLGLPLGRYDFKYSYPKYVNLAFELGKRGSLDKGQIKENYFFTTLSFTINDKWFSRSKLGL